jgi:hypothetical protein
MIIDSTVEVEAVGILANASNRLSSIADSVSDSDFLAEFLQLKVSPNTRRTYTQCLDDFFIRLASVHASMAKIAQRAKNVQVRFKPLLVMLFRQGQIRLQLESLDANKSGQHSEQPKHRYRPVMWMD